MRVDRDAAELNNHCAIPAGNFRVHVSLRHYSWCTGLKCGQNNLEKDQKLPSVEIAAMGAIEDAFGVLDDETRARVLGWAYAKYAAASDFSMGRSPQKAVEESRSVPAVVVGELEDETSVDRMVDRFQYFAELYDHCNPATSRDRFLVAAYWAQIKEGKESFGNSDINKLLKDQGHETPGLNKVVDRMRDKTPKLVLQLGGGAADKSRRVLKLTTPGLKAVEDMIANGG